MCSVIANRLSDGVAISFFKNVVRDFSPAVVGKGLKPFPTAGPSLEAVSQSLVVIARSEALSNPVFARFHEIATPRKARLAMTGVKTDR